MQQPQPIIVADLFPEILDALLDLLSSLSEDEWAAPTVCPGWSVKDLDLVEANEAFAAQACAVNKGMGWDPSIVNVNGGAIAIGHPIGASGARVFNTLVFEMRRRGAQKGLATLCIGGGMGVALCVEAL